MVSPFETTILKLQELGFFKFLLPFIFSAAVFYGLLRKTQIFGPPEKNIAVNAIVALTASFFVWAWPIIGGIDIEVQLAAFFMQGASILLVSTIVLLVAGMFLPPDLPKTIGEKIKGGHLVGGLIIGGIIIGIILLISSGLSQVFFPKGFELAMHSETFINIGVIILLLGAIALIVFVAR